MSLIYHRALQQLAANSVTRRGSVIAASMHISKASKSCLTLKSTWNPLPIGRNEAVTGQRRPFHPTPARRHVIIDLDEIASWCLVISWTVLLVRIYTGYSNLPPHIWARTADEQTRNEVEMTMSLAFNMARKAPVKQRNKRIREATFHVPHELARLNKRAPDFRIEDLGPLAPGWIPWETLMGKDGPPLNAKTDTRAFLYFPERSSKATAIFLAINSELRFPTRPLAESPPAYDKSTRYSTKPVALGRAFRVMYNEWKVQRPTVTGHFEHMGRLPVICNFQEYAYGYIYYPKSGMYPNTRMSITPLNVTDIGRKTSMF